MTIKILAMVMAMPLWSCGEDDENVNPEDASSVDGAVSLADVPEGRGVVQVTGNIEAEVSGEIRIYTTGEGTVDDYEYYKNEYVIESGEDEIYIDVYWPRADGAVMPEGDYMVELADLTDFPRTRFINVTVFVEQSAYSPWIETTGEAVIASTNADAELDIVFSVEGLEEFINEVSVNADGAAKFRVQ